ncbi:MAG: phosphoribosylpyrophosphate synthetase [Chitinophagales bacterium]
MEAYNNIVEAISALKQQGYTEDFNLKQNCLECSNGSYKVFHNEFEIDKSFRFEADDSSPDGESILYAISSNKYQIKGIMINAYSIYSDDIADEMLEKLKFT